MKRKGGHFKQKSEPTVIGANKDEPDTIEMLENMKNRQTEEGEDVQGDSQEDEDNDEGMGDLEVDTMTGVVDEEGSDDNEERKE